MRKSRSSNRVSGIQRFAAIGDWTTEERWPAARPAACFPRALCVASAQDLVHLDPTCTEGFTQDREAGVRAGLAAHEHVERGVAGVRPGMDRDVALGEDCNAGDAIGLKMMD